MGLHLIPNHRKDTPASQPPPSAVDLVTCTFIKKEGTTESTALLLSSYCCQSDFLKTVKSEDYSDCSDCHILQTGKSAKQE